MEGIPVFDTVQEAVSETGANTAMVFVPARFAADAIFEAVDAGIATVICITEGIPAHDILRVYNHVRPLGITLISRTTGSALSRKGERGNRCPPRSSARGASAGGQDEIRRADIPDRARADAASCGAVGAASENRGDPVVGSSFIDVLGTSQDDSETEIVVMVGEIGGAEEEKAAAFIEAEADKTP